MTCIGQLIGLVVAKTRPLAQRAAQLVKIEYKDLPAIITIEVTNYNELIKCVNCYVLNYRRLLQQNRIINRFGH